MHKIYLQHAGNPAPISFPAQQVCLSVLLGQNFLLAPGALEFAIYLDHGLHTQAFPLIAQAVVHRRRSTRNECEGRQRIRARAEPDRQAASIACAYSTPIIHSAKIRLKLSAIYLCLTPPLASNTSTLESNAGLSQATVHSPDLKSLIGFLLLEVTPTGESSVQDLWLGRLLLQSKLQSKRRAPQVEFAIQCTHLVKLRLCLCKALSSEQFLDWSSGRVEENLWAHVIAQPEKGCLLLAHPLMFMEHQAYFHQVSSNSNRQHGMLLYTLNPLLQIDPPCPF